MIKLAGVFARTTIHNARVRIEDVSLEAQRGVLAILGNESDGTSLLLDVIDGTRTPSKGSVVVLGGKPAQARVARVSALAPLPEVLTVEEVCALESRLRGESARPASARLATLGIAILARRSVLSLSLAERRAVALALALTSSAEVVLIEEPLAVVEPAAYGLLPDAVRARAASASVIVTTASPRDAMRLADKLGVLTRGSYSPVDPKLGDTKTGRASMRIVVAPAAGRAGAAAIASALGASDVVTHLEVSAYAPSSGAVGVLVSGSNLAELSRVVTRAIASARVDVDLVEPSALSLDAIRAAAMSAPEGKP